MSDVASDISLISSALPTVLSVISTVASIPPAIVSAVESTVKSIQDNAGKIAEDAETDPSKIQAISDGVSAIAGALAPYVSAAPAIGATIQAALVLAKVVLNMVGRGHAAAVPQVSAHSSVPTPEQAREMLAAAKPA